jgi:diketogulonate reductase-like aldo/keto reductase
MVHVNIQDVRVPQLGLGTWRLTGSTCERAVAEALDIGYRHIDTAQMYGNEAQVGGGIAASAVDPRDLFVTTKLSSRSLTPEAVRSSTEESLRRLRLDAIDLLLIHHPARPDVVEDTLGAMQEVRNHGLVRHLGVSNFPVDLLERALRSAELFAIQVEYHPFRSQEEQLDAARRHDLLFQAYSPLARGGVPGHDAIEDVAREIGATAAQVALRWLIDQPNVVPIPKASSREHLEENWGALDVKLDDDARTRLDSLSHRERPAAEIGD